MAAHRPTPGRRDLLAVASLLLQYPDDAACGQRDAVTAAISELPDSKPAAQLRRLAAWRRDTDPGELRRDYVVRFDTRRRTCLDVTFALYGDSRERGPALQEFNSLYRAAGYAPADGELPDFLPLVLQFAALAPAPAAARALALARPGVAAAAAALAKQGSPYADGLAAVLGLIDDAADADAADDTGDIEGGAE
ncbi:MAG: nitrate reductase molybdenum cofactor assembly chaperone [Propionibacteriaceae bacterium]|jgi:nitrate reductase delta subunit|nr:nitrate reductase molybdenum cofactor assembly chaperone [Propionibacteriaceae bacterium]